MGIPHNIDVRIENLVLHGFDNADATRIGESLERKLTSLLSKGGLPALLSQDGDYMRLDGGQFTLPHEREPEVIGAGVAQAVIGGIECSDRR
jgi:hypothetical protein